MRQITILQIFSGDLWAGAEVMIYGLISELKNVPGVKIIALGLNEGVLAEKLRQQGVETYIISESKYSFLTILFRSYWLLKGRNINIIHSHRYKENLLGFLLAKLVRVKGLISTSHGLSEVPDSSKRVKVSMDRAIKFDYGLLRRFFSYVVVVSKEMKDVFIEKYKFDSSKIHVVYNGIALPMKNNAVRRSNEKSFHIGTVGRMVPVKNFNLFLNIADELKRKVGDVRLSILGEGPMREELVCKVKALGLDDCVEFREPCVDPTSYYQSLDLYLNTSFHEGIPLSILEAMSHSIPVVAPKIGGIPEIINDDTKGILIEDYSSKSFVKACVALIENARLRSSIGYAARDRVKSLFSRTYMMEQYMELYQQVE